MSEYIKTNYLRLSSLKGTLSIEVCTVEWMGTCTPISNWHIVKKMEKSCSITEVESVIKNVLSDKKYFRTCTSCKELNISGHMHDSEM
jgi:hypothetical protein